MRLDKYLKVSRLIKRRTVAAEAASGGRIYVNGAEAKPGRQLKVGDIIEVRFGTGALRVRVRDLSEHMAKGDAETMYEVLE